MRLNRVTKRRFLPIISFLVEVRPIMFIPLSNPYATPLYFQRQLDKANIH